MTCPRCGAPLPVDAPSCGGCGLTRDTGTRRSNAAGDRSPDQRGADAQRWADSSGPNASPTDVSPYGAPTQHPLGPPYAAPPPYGRPPTAGGAAPSAYAAAYGPPPYPPQTLPSPSQPHYPPLSRSTGGWPPGRPPHLRPPREQLREGTVRVARLAQALAALACLVHGLVSMTVRRSAYVDLGRGGGSASSDQLNAVLLAIASLSSLLALGLAVYVLARRRGRSAASGTGLALFGLGWLVVLVGAALVAGADTRAAAATAALAAVLVGVGFVVVAVGHALLAPGLAAAERDGSLATAPYPGPDPYVGTPLARHPADRSTATTGIRTPSESRFDDPRRL